MSGMGRLENLQRIKNAASLIKNSASVRGSKYTFRTDDACPQGDSSPKDVRVVPNFNTDLYLRKINKFLRTNKKALKSLPSYSAAVEALAKYVKLGKKKIAKGATDKSVEASHGVNEIFNEGGELDQAIEAEEAKQTSAKAGADSDAVATAKPPALFNVAVTALQVRQMRRLALARQEGARTPSTPGSDDGGRWG